MDKRIRILISVITLVNILSLNNVVYASIFDWFSTGQSSSTASNSLNLSFDNIYTNIFSPSNDNVQVDGNKSSSLAVQSQSVVQTNRSMAVRSLKVQNIYTVMATAYSSTPDQTDSTPFITASGTHVRDGVIAANFLPIGTVIKIPELYGDKLFVVEDRMNRRYWQKIDIWFAERSDALEFGIQKVTIEIVS